jgi:hypothetical protein
VFDYFIQSFGFIILPLTLFISVKRSALKITILKIRLKKIQNVGDLIYKGSNSFRNTADGNNQNVITYYTGKHNTRRPYSDSALLHKFTRWTGEISEEIRKVYL